MINKFRVKIFLVILFSFISVNLIAKGEEELTPKLFVKRIINFLPEKLASLVYKKEKTSPFATAVLSKEKLEKVKLFYNNEEFEAFVDPNIELTQEKIRMLYYYWKLVNKK
jgi:hypothetical protein